MRITLKLFILSSRLRLQPFLCI